MSTIIYPNKLCKTCGEIKNPTEFHSNKKNRDGLSYTCKPCATKRACEWQKKNPERRRAISAKHYENNVDKLKELRTADKESAVKRADKWRRDNPDRHLASVKRRRQSNRERFRKYGSDWQKSNPGKVNANTVKYRSRKRNAVPKWASLDKIREFYINAKLISEFEGSPYEVDHIVPLKSELVCGLHCESNLQILPKLENIIKSNNFWPDMP